jgi:uncharacterized membrane protein YfhO
VVEPDPTVRVQLLASGTLPDDQVILDSPGATTDGQPATVDWVNDGMNTMILHVNAEGAGYLVLADPIQHGWTATVDGARTAIVPADHAFAAVPVPAGDHEIRFVYRPVSLLVGGVSGLTALGLLIPAILEYRRGRRRRPILAPVAEAVSP